MEPMRDFSFEPLDSGLGAPEPAPDMVNEIIRLGGLIERGIETLENEQLQYQEVLRGVVIGEDGSQIVSENLSNEEGRLYRNLSRLSKATGISIEKLLSGDLFTIEDVKIGEFDRLGERVQFTAEELLKTIAAEDYSSYEMFAGLIRPEDIGDSLEAIAGELEQDPGLNAAQQEALDSYNELQIRIDRLVETNNMLSEEPAFSRTDGQLVSLSFAAVDVLVDEPVMADALTDAIPRLNRALEELAPQFADIDVYENPEVRKRLLTSELPVLSPAPTTKDVVSDADAQRAALRSTTTAPTTESFSPERLKEPVSATVTQPAMSADEQRAQFRAAMAEAPDKPEEPTIDVDDAIAMLEGNGFSVVPRSNNLSGASTTATTAESDQEEVKRILAERFGGIGFFLNPDDPDMMVGIAYDAGGRPYIVAVDDPAATGAAVDLLTAIEMTGITSDSAILAAVQKTKWHQTTDAMMRKYDLDTANMNPFELEEYLEPVLNILTDEAIFLGIQLDPARAMELAEHIQRQGKNTDLDYIRQFLNSEGLYVAANLEASAFANLTDGVMALSRSYFTPINEEMAAKYANDLYMGLETNDGMEALFRDQAAARYPFMVNALNSGQTPEAYFAPYTYEVERLLGRKNIDLYEEFPDIIEGIRMSNGEYRPMTTHELRRYVRGLAEWQQSPQGLDSARSLSFAIGELFGEVA